MVDRIDVDMFRDMCYIQKYIHIYIYSSLALSIQGIVESNGVLVLLDIQWL